jgi:hypothetical protein
MLMLIAKRRSPARLAAADDYFAHAGVIAIQGEGPRIAALLRLDHGWDRLEAQRQLRAAGAQSYPEAAHALTQRTSAGSVMGAASQVMQ